jgi:hypothetical protein
VLQYFLKGLPVNALLGYHLALADAIYEHPAAYLHPSVHIGEHSFLQVQKFRIAEYIVLDGLGGAALFDRLFEVSDRRTIRPAFTLDPDNLSLRLQEAGSHRFDVHPLIRAIFEASVIKVEPVDIDNRFDHLLSLKCKGRLAAALRPDAEAKGGI